MRFPICHDCGETITSSTEYITHMCDRRGDSKNAVLLGEFMEFCAEHPELRFWQALAAWTGRSVYLSRFGAHYVDVREIKDTFYFEGKDK